MVLWGSSNPMALDLYNMTCGSVETFWICYLVLSHPGLMWVACDVESREKTKVFHVQIWQSGINVKTRK